MPTTLTNGIQLPDKGSVDWYNSMQSNYNLIDTHLGNTDTHVTAEDKANWNSKQGSLSQAQLDAIAQVATNTSDIATLQSGKANVSHTHSSSDITDIGDFATKQYVDNSISGLVDNAPAALDTLKELSTALNDDANFASTVTTALAAKANSADLATVATSGSYNDLSNKPTINDSTITIQKNGSTVDTFTTNGSSKTINIPVPTKTSDLTNDSNFVDTSNSAVSSGITSAKVTDYDTHIADTDIHVTTADKTKWNNGVTQAYVLRYSGTAITDNSTIAYSTLDNTDNIKVSDKIIDTDGKIFSIVSVDSDNSTVTVGSALIDLALDANVMHLSGDETALGKKTFADLTTFNSWLYFTNSSVTKGTIPQSTVNPYRFCFGSGVNYAASLFNIDTSVSNLGVQTLTFRAAENVVSGDDARLMLIYDPNRSQPKYLSLKGDLEPNANNTYECGSSSNRLKDLYVYHGYLCGQQKGDEFSVNARTDLTLLANRDTLGQSGVCISKFRQNRAQGEMSGTDVVQVTFDVLENSVRSNRLWYLNWVDWENDVPKTVEVRSFCEKVDYKLTHINNKNPGSLSLPDLNNGLDISGYLDVSQSSRNYYTPSVNGWISIKGRATSTTNGIVIMQGDFCQMGQSVVDLDTTDRVSFCMLPVTKNVQVEIWLKSVTTISSAKFYPCLGNV